MIEAVLFDLDGTLIDSTEAILECFFHTFDAIGEARPEPRAVVTTISLVLEDQFGRLTAHDTGECARIYRERYSLIAPALTTLQPGAREILESCREEGWRTGFVTSKRRSASETLLGHLGVLDFFEARVGPEDVRRPKPDPEPVTRALDMLGVAPGRAVYVGDMRIDVEAAHAAGVRCVAVSTGYESATELRRASPCAVAGNLAQVTRILRHEAARAG